MRLTTPEELRHYIRLLDKNHASAAEWSEHLEITLGQNSDMKGLTQELSFSSVLLPSLPSKNIQKDIEQDRKLVLIGHPDLGYPNWTTQDVKDFFQALATIIQPNKLEIRYIRSFSLELLQIFLQQKSTFLSCLEIDANSSFSSPKKQLTASTTTTNSTNKTTLGQKDSDNSSYQPYDNQIKSTNHHYSNEEHVWQAQKSQQNAPCGSLEIQVKSLPGHASMSSSYNCHHVSGLVAFLQLPCFSNGRCHRIVLRDIQLRSTDRHQSIQYQEKTEANRVTTYDEQDCLFFQALGQIRTSSVLELDIVYHTALQELEYSRAIANILSRNPSLKDFHICVYQCRNSSRREEAACFCSTRLDANTTTIGSWLIAQNNLLGIPEILTKNAFCCRLQRLAIHPNYATTIDKFSEVLQWHCYSLEELKVYCPYSSSVCIPLPTNVEFYLLLNKNGKRQFLSKNFSTATVDQPQHISPALWINALMACTLLEDKPDDVRVPLPFFRPRSIPQNSQSLQEGETNSSCCRDTWRLSAMYYFLRLNPGLLV